MMESALVTSENLLAVARKCLDYAPGTGDVGDWRRAFDRLADLRRETGRSLIRSDRDRLAAIVAEIAVLAANCGELSGRAFLTAIGCAVADFTADDSHFLTNGNFARGDHG